MGVLMSAEQPFADTELVAAFRVFLPEARAREMVGEIMTRGRHGEQSGRWRSADFVSFDQDLLILLSLQSDSTNEKVERYRRLGGYEPTRADQEQWEARRAELEAAVEQSIEYRRAHPDE